jgi:hypothetical protein
MKILLIGEYSNVHATLAKGLRELGHYVVVVSNGDFWKDYPRDYDVSRKNGQAGGIILYAKLIALLPRMRGFDIVQLINPLFFELKAERHYLFYNYLRKHNKCIIMGAFGMDYYWVHECITRMPLRYSDFNIGHKLRTDEEAIKYRKDWIGTEKEKLNKYIAQDCDNIVAGLYEYWACYKPVFENKTKFCPYPIIAKSTQPRKFDGTLRLFIGINRERSIYKGTDIMLKAAEDMKTKYGERIELNIAESIPFNDYIKMMNGSDAILDQLYSYTPSMNSLEAMSNGIICIGGGEEENYNIINEHELRPIVNTAPCYDGVVTAIEYLMDNTNNIDKMKNDSMLYIKKHHEYITIAKKYIEVYEQSLGNKDNTHY